MRSHGFALAVAVAAVNDMLGIISYFGPASDPSFDLEDLVLPCMGTAEQVEQFVVQIKNF